MARVALAPRGAFVLIGFMGAGKSTVAAELAAALGVSMLDSDALLADRLGHSIAEEFDRSSPDPGEIGHRPQVASDGERAFRAKEEELVCELLSAAEPGGVIALGGGSVLSERVRRALEEHVVVLLDVSGEEAWERVSSQDGGSARPLARDREEFMALHAERRPMYDSIADAHLPMLGRGEASHVPGALRALAGAPLQTRMLWARSASGAYPVLIGRGLLQLLSSAQLTQAWRLERPGSRAFCVTDRTVLALYGEHVSEPLGKVAIAPGEEHKSLGSAEEVWQAMVSAGVTRADHVLALGGGVVGDLAGFCAATYQRGVAVVHAPTTLVGQVDSAYGGKTGVDLPSAKNYIGAYHQPAGVLIDPDTLATLPAAELAAGWVEVLKTALIAGGGLWRRVSRGDDVDEQMILACARTKIAVVAADERDAGRRQVLNLGHTVAHAIETATSYRRYRHGEAVGLGLLAALRLSGSDGLRGQVREMLIERGLPVRLEDTSPESVLSSIARDKKRRGAGVPFVLAKGPGDVSVGHELAEQDVRAAVSELLR